MFGGKQERLTQVKKLDLPVKKCVLNKNSFFKNYRTNLKYIKDVFGEKQYAPWGEYIIFIQDDLVKYTAIDYNGNVYYNQIKTYLGKRVMSEDFKYGITDQTP